MIEWFNAIKINWYERTGWKKIISELLTWEGSLVWVVFKTRRKILWRVMANSQWRILVFYDTYDVPLLATDHYIITIWKMGHWRKGKVCLLREQQFFELTERRFITKRGGYIYSASPCVTCLENYHNNPNVQLPTRRWVNVVQWCV